MIGLVAGLSSAPAARAQEAGVSFDVLGITATVDGIPAVVEQQLRGPKRPRTFTGPETPWFQAVDTVRFVPETGVVFQSLRVRPAERLRSGPPDAAPASVAPRKARVAIAFTLRALDPENVRLAIAPRGMTVEAGGIRTAVPRDGRVEVAVEHDLASTSPVAIVFHPAGATLELVIGPG